LNYYRHQSTGLIYQNLKEEKGEAGNNVMGGGIPDYKIFQDPN
jgi:hypothetical protein